MIDYSTLALNLRRTFPVVLFSVFSACSSVSTQTAESVTTSEAVAVFQETCLSSLPDFSNFSELSRSVQLQAFSGLPGVNEAHQLPGKRLFVGLSGSPVGKTCVLIADSEDNAASLGQAVLSASMLSTNSTVKNQYPSSFFEYAVRLSNNSLLTQDLRNKSGPNRSIFFISVPLTEEQIRVLIYN